MLSRSARWLVSGSLVLGGALACDRAPPPPPAPRTPAPTARRTLLTHPPPAADPDVDGGRAERALTIPARSHAPGAPPEGWCGETAIQESLLYLGIWASQARVNRVGHPAHPDLYSNEIPRTLDALGVRYVRYAATGAGFEAFDGWVRAAIDAGDPVLAGVKILPTAHPEWGLDHFVLVVGYGAGGLLVNTTWGHREWVTPTRTRGLSFVNAGYAIRMLGARRTEGALPARLTVVGEEGANVRLRVACVGARDGDPLRVVTRAAIGGGAVKATADAPRGQVEVRVAADDDARFECVAP